MSVLTVLFGFHVIEAYMFDRITISAVKHTYDITEIDTVANQHVARLKTGNKGSGNKKVSRNIDGVSRTNIMTV
jgi:hypothetical protein